MPQPRTSAYAALKSTPLVLPPTPYQAIVRSARHFPERPALTFLSGGQTGAPVIVMRVPVSNGAAVTSAMSNTIAGKCLAIAASASLPLRAKTSR